MRNYGVSQSNGSIIAFTDADISVAIDWLQKGIYYLARRDVVCIGGLIDIPANATWIEKAWNLKEQIKPTNTERSWHTSMNLFVKKKAFLAAGGFNEQLKTCEDVDLCYRIRSLGKLIYHKDVRVIHYGKAKTLSHFFLKEKWRGQSNLKGFFSHDSVLSELPSVILPILYLWLYLSTIPLLIFTTTKYIALIQLGILLSIPALRSLAICTKGKRITFSPHYLLFG